MNCIKVFQFKLFSNSFVKLSILSYFLIIAILHPQISYASSIHLGLKINYQTGMSHVEKKDMPVIEMLRRISVTIPKSKFLISGHTDIVGSYEMNVELSRSRADIIKLLLVRFGVEDGRIETKWFSYDAPIDTNEEDEGRAKNRRTVATVYGLTSDQAEQLTIAANKSKRFYVINMENEKVTDYVAEVLVPQITELNVESNIESNIESTVEPQIEEESLVKIEAESEESSTAEPVILPKKEKVRTVFNRHRYSVGWAVTDNELTANNKQDLYKAIWITDFNQSLSLGYQYKITNKYWLGASGAYGLQNYRLEQNAIFNWDGITPNLIRFSANLDYQTNKKMAFGFDINYSEENFIISDGGLNIFLQKAALFGVSARSSYRFYDSKNLSSRFKGHLEIPISGSDEINPKGKFGLILGADVTFKSLMKTQEVNFGAFLGLRSFENDENNQDETVAGFEIKFRNKRWP